MLARIVCAVALTALLAGTALAEDLSPEKRQDILRLLEVSGSREAALQLLQANSKQALNLVKKMRPDIPPASMPAVERELQAFVAEKISAPGGLLEQVVPIYAQRFSHAEVRQLVAFYESPVGRKFLAAQPQMLREARDMAQRLGIGLIPEANRRINEALKREAQAREAQDSDKPTQL